MADTGSREAAWARLHDPSTDAATLAAIAQKHPEFADAVARHPNCYPELRAWLDEFALAATQSAATESAASASAAPASYRDSDAEAAVDPGSANTAGTVRRRRPRARVIGAAAAGALLLAGGAVWGLSALTPGESGDASASSAQAGAEPATQGPRRLSGEPVYIGDELEWLLPDDDEVRAFFPGAGVIKRSAEVGGIGESEGINTVPSECVAWVLTDSYAVIGARAAKGTGVSVRVLQFPTPALAADYYRDSAGTTPACARFDIRSGDQAYATRTLRAVAQTPAGIAVHSLESGTNGMETVQVYVLEGNVVVWATASAPLDDAQASSWLRSLTDRAAQARSQLTDRIGYR